jgi:hypothetical protein
MMFPLCRENYAGDFGRAKLTSAMKRRHRPQQCLYFLPLPQGQGEWRPTFGPVRKGFGFFCHRRCRLDSQ